LDYSFFIAFLLWGIGFVSFQKGILGIVAV
jgi:hypothetical protein